MFQATYYIYGYVIVASLLGLSMYLGRKNNGSARDYARMYIYFLGVTVVTATAHMFFLGSACIDVHSPVQSVIPGSPADIAGVRIGDRPGDPSGWQGFSFRLKTGRTNITLPVIRSINDAQQLLKLNVTLPNSTANIHATGITAGIIRHRVPIWQAPAAGVSMIFKVIRNTFGTLPYLNKLLLHDRIPELALMPRINLFDACLLWLSLLTVIFPLIASPLAIRNMIHKHRVELGDPLAWSYCQMLCTEASSSLSLPVIF